MVKAVKTATAAINYHAGTGIRVPRRDLRPGHRPVVSRAEVAEIPFTTFAAQRKADQIPGRLVVRRIPDFNAETKRADGQGTVLEVRRFHAFFTTADPQPLDMVAADKTHRGHAIVEPVHADLKGSAWHTCRPGSVPPAPPGWCSRSSRLTSPAPPAR